MRILIASNQTSMRLALKMFFETRPGLEVIGEVSDNKELMIQVKAERPDLLLLEDGLTGEMVDEVIASLRQLDTRLAVIFLSGRPELKQPALAAGADAFIMNSDPPKSLLTAIEAIRLREGNV